MLVSFGIKGDLHLFLEELGDRTNNLDRTSPGQVKYVKKIQWIPIEEKNREWFVSEKLSYFLLKKEIKYKSW